MSRTEARPPTIESQGHRTFQKASKATIETHAKLNIVQVQRAENQTWKLLIQTGDHKQSFP